MTDPMTDAMRETITQGMRTMEGDNNSNFDTLMMRLGIIQVRTDKTKPPSIYTKILGEEKL